MGFSLWFRKQVGGGTAAGTPAAANIQGSPLHVSHYLGDDSRKKKKRKLRKEAHVLDEPRTLYIRRNVVNAEQIVNWAKDSGFTTTLPPEDMHVTIAFSRTPIPWSKIVSSNIDGELVIDGGAREIAQFDVGAVVLKFTSPELAQRWSQICNMGASWDWPSYQPHITISYQADDVDLANIVPYEGEIRLGWEIFDEVNEDWKDNIVEKASAGPIETDDKKDELGMTAATRKPEDVAKPRSRASEPLNKKWTDEVMEKIGARHSKTDNEMIQNIHDAACNLGAQCGGHHDNEGMKVQKFDATIMKVDDALGMVFGYAIICKVDGSDYYDLNIDPDGKRVPEHIPEGTMLKSSMDFMQNSRIGSEMHKEGSKDGTYLYAFPLTTDIAKSLGIETRTTGLLVGFKPSPELFAKFKDGTYKGFSIEGKRLAVEEVNE